MGVHVGDADGEAELAGGTIIAGRYRTERCIGRGGMGRVYHVVDEGAGEPFALKMLGAVGSGAALAESLFEREYHALTQLEHPNVVRVFDYGVHREGDGAMPFYTMELLGGHGLRGQLPLDFRRAASLVRDVCSALALLHSRRLLHRDVGLRNLRLDAAGRAKLIDFGAMSSMGPCDSLVGTPPATPPEVLRGQELDGRVDLYGVGALLYRLLTNRYPYPAQRMRELPERWLRTPPPPSRLSADVPRALDELVMELLSLEPQARPRTATEVIARLTAIADLAPEDHGAVSRSYLVTPRFVGREEVLSAIDEAIDDLSAGRGGALQVVGDAGAGRSRALEHAVVYARLAGHTVLRAATRAYAATPFSLLRALCDTGVEAVPDALVEAVGGDTAFVEVAPRLADRVQAPRLPGERTRRDALIGQAVVDTLRRLARHRPVLIAIDDLDHGDPQSLSVLTLLLSELGGAPLALVFTREAGTSDNAALEVLGELCPAMELAPLDAGEVETLLRSVFGDARGLPGVAEWVHRVARGMPRQSMEMAQHLVDGGHARFSHGHWELPEDLTKLPLPESLEDAFQRQMDGLSAPARRLAALVALHPDRSPITTLELSRLGELDPALSGGALHAALEELRQGRVVTTTGERVVLRHRGFEAPLLSGLDAAARREHHRLLAHLLSGRDPSDLAVLNHLQEAGLDDAALDRLRPAQDDLRAHNTMRYLSTPQASLAERVLRRALEHAKARCESAALLHSLWLSVNTLASAFDVPGAFEEPMDALERDLGLDLLPELDPALDPAKRIQKAVELATVRYTADPSPDHLHPGQALLVYGLNLGQHMGRAAATLDLQMLDRAIDRLAVLAPLLPVFEQMRRQYQTVADGLRGLDTREQVKGLLHELDGRTPGLDDFTRFMMRAAMRFQLGIDLARSGDPSLEIVEALRRPETRDISVAIEMLVHINQGRIEQAEALQDEMRARSARGLSRMYLDNLLNHEIGSYALVENVTALRRLLEPARERAERRPGWQPLAIVASACHDLVRGEPEQALSQAERVLSEVAAGGHGAWGLAAPTALRALLELERYAEASERAAELSTAARDRRTHPIVVSLLMSMQAMADALLGRPSALALAHEADAIADAAGVQGLPRLHVAMHGARAAIAAADRVAYDRFVATLERICNTAGGSALFPLTERVRTAAAAHAWPAPSTLPPAPGEPLDDLTESEVITVPGSPTRSKA